MEVDAIRDVKDIARMKEFFRKKGSGYELLFVMGINTALRIGDLLSLRVRDVLDAKGGIVRAFALREEKTGKMKRCTVNESIREALAAYFESGGKRAPGESLFISRMGRTLSRCQAWRVIKAAGRSAGLENIGAHSLRKTFGYHVYKNSGENIGLVQKLLNHSTSSVTLRYIGIDREEMDNVCMELNL